MIKFNEQQLKAINHKDGACAVIAGAGSGKSTVMVERIKTLIENSVDGQDILAISFTRNTAKELKKKLKRKGISDVNTGTFHAICNKILIQEGLNPHKHVLNFEVKNAFNRYNHGKVNTKEIMDFISYQKNYNRTYTDDFVFKETSYTDEELREYFKVYEDLKDKKKAMDFDDSLIKCLKILQKNPNKYTFKYVLVDEHQDSNLVQNMLIKSLCPSNNVFCVFDYRQAIYTFRGGNPEYCMNFNKEFPNATIINLDVNYRSTNNIVENANNFIKQYYGDYEFYSDGLSQNKDNGKIKILTNYGKEEAKMIVDKIEKQLEDGANPSDFAILYRLNSSPEYIENELKVRDIDYFIDNESSFFKRKEINGILSILRLIQNPHDNEAFENVFNLRTKPLGFMSNNILDEITAYAAVNDKSYYEASQLIKYPQYWQEKNATKFDEYIYKLSLQYKKNNNLMKLINNVIVAFSMEEWLDNNFDSKEEVDERIEAFDTLKSFVRSNTLESFINYVYSSDKSKRQCKEDCVKLMSVHKSKGLEFKTVFVIGIEDGKFPHKKSDILDEARLFYVAITRAKENLYISQIYEGNLFVEQYKKDMKKKIA